ncbi:MAG TPA: sulfatase-like hydrolase/transferase [bacterium]|nr:sulfatase-like hydrolase/transferase [Candidatus Omnitrophota bacterium]HOJ62082.1 sulfatase-like hydrolase/transferase [bacterium]HOL93869.1 sulfatase-like hydrolase/transferase [bacterium]HPP00452.1 sulfatase-like hydrolase/transferase [bacterium]HXK93462.1 sulfatase-like hydrolase/transferase [bacterium]
MYLLRWTGIALAALLLSTLRAVAAWAADWPNVLMIVSDDHAAYVCGAYGNRQARTPNLDRLARTGVTFTNAFVNCPMCTPSRQSFLTGRLPHAIGVTQLTTALPDEPVTLAEALKELGYATAAIGKMHFNSTRAHGFDVRLDLGDHQGFLTQHPPRPVPAGIEVLPVWKPFQDPARIWLNGSYLPYGAFDKDYSGTWFARQGQQFLRGHTQTPFFLMVSFYEPHSPFRFPIEYRGRFDPASFAVPQPGPEDDWQIPEIFRNLTDEEKRHIIAAYYTSTEFMDHNVGRILDTLEETGLDDNTLVIYLGDNGYSLGQHGRFEKHTMYEESVRAPLIIRLPGQERFDQQEDALVEFIDLFPTIMEFCGGTPPPEVEGRSLLPLLEGKTERGHEPVFSEYYDNEEAMIRTREYKFIYSTGRRERQDGYKTGFPLSGRTRRLYDLRNDPQEMTNLAGGEKYRELIIHFQQEMLRRFEASHPLASQIPPDLTLEDALDYYLTWREEK